MSAIDPSIDSMTDSIKRVIRVKRKANEEKSIANKRCKYIGSIDTNDDKDIYQLLISTQTLPQKEIEDQNNRLKITDYEELMDFKDQDFEHKIDSIINRNEIITCNGEALERVENDLSETYDYIYDIYIYENNENNEFEENDYRECDDEEVNSDDENYIFNDYPDEKEFTDQVFDYNYSDYENDSQTDLRRNFGRTRISSDYDLTDEELSQKYPKNSSDFRSSEDEDEY